MAQIRSKQIADFLANVNWSNVSANDIANAADIKAYVDSNDTAIEASIDSVDAKISADLVSTDERLDDKISTEISTTNSEIDSLDVRVAQDIANLAAEISETTVDFTSIDLRVSIDEEELAAHIASGDVRDLNLEKSVDSLEVFGSELSTETSNAFVTERQEREDADAALADSVDSLEGKADTDMSSIETRVSLDEDALAAEILRATAAEGFLADSVDSLEIVDAEISAAVSVILDGSTVDLDQFAEVVAYVDSLDQADDNFLTLELASINTRMTADEADLSAEISTTDSEVASINVRMAADEGALDSHISSGDLRDANLEASVDSLEIQVSLDEAALSAEISTTNSEVASIDLRVSNEISTTNSEVASIDLRVSNEISTTNSEVASMDLRVSIEEEATLSRDIVLQDNLDGFATATGENLTELQNSVDSIEDLLAGTSGNLDASVDSLETRVSIEESALSAEISTTNSEMASMELRVSLDENALSTEISTTNSEVVSLNTRVSIDEANLAAEITRATAAEGFLADSVDSLEIVDAEISAAVSVILDGSTVDLDQFAEVVAYVDSLDQADDNFLTLELASINLRMTNDEADLSTEISETNSDLIRIELDIDSLELRLSQEEGARAAGDDYVEDTVVGVVEPALTRFTVNVPNNSFAMGTMDTEVYVNGLRVAFTQLTPNDFEFEFAYPVEATDIFRFVGVRA